ncbi:ethanolamine ammonia-lyase subunit EutC [Paucibacter sp. TC2R-5]|uniref:ethanolamine ammonia-lyase subunit EutC n=1 Tax=Paucibacter sp. TC2R-5 TaxID=2893555 RepID=UPI0021E4291C|nr:ethanolamine ammonia-lyase subunit EutC [Paucibacter sp. TC2R-5]MCV2359876.1 ethanolamine ammonia-lyase subunit EutC [Paucibacter sp. TC2R-5]
MSTEVQQDPWEPLRRHTPARIGIGRAGTSLPTRELLDFNAAHAQARDAVLTPLNVAALGADLSGAGWAWLSVQSRAAGRDIYLRRPDLGRRLDEASLERLRSLPLEPAPAPAPLDLVIVLGDGLSAVATQTHALRLLSPLKQALGGQMRIGPLLIATQARVALGDEIGAVLGARAVLVLLGERPGLSSPDSLGAYLTFGPALGRSDAERNCVSNIRPAGLVPELAAQRLAWLLREALRRGLSGVGLKDDSERELLGGP